MGAAPIASSQRVANVMRGNRSRDTAPELSVRRLLHARGRRFRVNLRPVASLRRTADIVFTRHRIAVFIDGCYWHGCPEHHTTPKTNTAYWSAKVQGNRDRDVRVGALLADTGWTVLRFWEHQDPAAVAAAIIDAVGERRVGGADDRPAR